MNNCLPQHNLYKYVNGYLCAWKIIGCLSFFLAPHISKPPQLFNLLYLKYCQIYFSII
jgi:hypothetical protein